MPNILDEILRGQRNAGSFLSGYRKSDLSGGLFGGARALGKSLFPTEVDAVTGAAYKPPPPPPPQRTSPGAAEHFLNPTIPQFDVGEGSIPLAKGVETIGGKNIAPKQVATEPSPLTDEMTQRLIAGVGARDQSLIEVKLKDGTTVKGTAPAPAPAVEGGGEGGEAGSFLDFLTTPSFAHIAGRVAQAITPDPTHGANIAGGIAAQLGTNKAYDDYFKRLQSGESIASLNAGGEFNILSPELKANALKDVLSERQQGVSQTYTETLTKQSEAITAATPTVEQRFDHETMIAMIRNGTRMNDWQVWGYGQMRNKTTGEIVGVPVAPRGGADKQVQNRQWYKQAYNEAVRSPAVLQFVKGNIVVGADGTPVFQWTDPVKGQEALQFAMRERLKLFQAQGLVPTGYLDLASPAEITRIDPETGETQYFKPNPDGTATRIR